MRNEGGEGVDGGWVDGDYAGFAAHIGEGLGAGAWGYVAAVAAHQTELRGGGGDGELWRGLWVHLASVAGPLAGSSSSVFAISLLDALKTRKRVMAAASFKWILQLHKDVPRAARFYSEGLDFTVHVCTLRWAELQSGPLKLALMQSNDHIVQQKGYSSLLSFTVTDINSTVTKLMAMGAELDGPIKYEIHGKVASMRCIDGHMLGLYEPA
ncbi:hypothetical protein SDJN03_07928, partial [Cucurbita argyrosperma subsp. sororia]